MADEPLGIRLNNPFNIRHSKGNDWQGQVGVENGFAQFDTPESGIRAADRLLTNYGKKGIATIRATLHRFAPTTENNTKDYVDFVAEHTGIDPDEEIDLSDPAVRRPIMAAMAKMETGYTLDGAPTKSQRLSDSRNMKMDDGVVEEIKRRYAAGELTEEEQAAARPILEQYIQERGSAQPKAEPGLETYEPVPSGDARENLAGAMKGMGLPEGLANSPAADFAMGIGETLRSTEMGLRQLASTPEEAQALGLIEAKAREQYAKVDEGIGMEDAGQALMFLGMMAVPGGAPLKVGLRGLSVLQKAGVLLKGNVAYGTMAGLLDATQGKTPDESRALSAAITAGTTMALSKLGQKMSTYLHDSAGEGVLGSIWKTLGVGWKGGPPGHRTAQETLLRSVVNKLWGAPRARLSDVERQQLRLAGGANSVEARRAIAQQGKAELDAAMNRPPVSAQAWDTYVEQIKLLGRTRPLQAQKSVGETLGIPAKDVAEMHQREARNIIAQLTSRALYNRPDGRLGVNLKSVVSDLEELKLNSRYEKDFSKQVRGKIDAAVNTLRQTGQDMSVPDFTKKTLAALRGVSEEAVENTRNFSASIGKTMQDGLNPGGRAAGALPTTGFPGWGDIEEFISRDDGGLGLVDLFSTLDEQVEKRKVKE